MLFGLDMLKAHQACIDLERNVLRIRGREVSFLPEHELPKNALGQDAQLADTPPQSGPVPAPGPSASQPRFPGAGQSLSSAPSPSPNLGSQPSGPQGGASQRFPEKDVQAIMALGVDRNMALQVLEAAGGNVDVACSLLF